MDFKKYKKIQADMQRLPNVVVESMLGEDKLLISHKTKRTQFEVPFVEQADGSITVMLGKGIKVGEATPTPYSEFQENAKRFKTASVKVFSNFNEGIKDLKKCYKELPQVENVEALKPAQPVNRFASKKANLESLCMSSVKPVSAISTKFKHKILAAIQEENDFIELFNFFENDGEELKSHDFNFNTTKKMYEETYKNHEKFKTHLNKMTGFHSKVEAIVESKDIANAIMNDLNFKEGIKVSVPKTIVKTKNQFAEAKFNVVDASKKIIAAFNEAFDPSEVNDTVFNSVSANDDAGHPEFLKFSKGKYTRDDLAALEHELEQSFYVLPDITDEDLRQIAAWRNQAMYMARTGMISDKMVDEIISDFNAAYTQNTDAMYKDGDMMLGRQDIADQGGSIDGIADMTGQKKVKDLKIDTFEIPDEEPMPKPEKDAVIA